MTLCIADRDRPGHLYLAADSLKTWPHFASDKTDEQRTLRRTFTDPFPKLVLLRPDLCVAVAGDDPEGSVELLCEFRESSIAEIHRACSQRSGASFIVASATDGTTTTIVNGSLRTSVEPIAGWVGDERAFGQFRRFHDGVTVEEPRPPRALQAIGQLIEHRLSSTVDGFLLTAFANRSSFELNGVSKTVHSENTYVSPVRHDDTTVTVRMTPENPDDIQSHVIFGGRDLTPGATGFLIVEAGVAVLFRHDRPWEAIRESVATPDDFVAWAKDEHGQTIAGIVPPPASPTERTINKSDLPGWSLRQMGIE